MLKTDIRGQSEWEQRVLNILKASMGTTDLLTKVYYHLPFPITGQTAEGLDHFYHITAIRELCYSEMLTFFLHIHYGRHWHCNLDISIKKSYGMSHP